MATATELVMSEQYQHVQSIADARGWHLKKSNGVCFIIGLPAHDKSWFWLLVDCENFPQQPPAFYWFNPETNARNQPCDTPKNNGRYFHDSGRICAPWNRLAYKSCDPAGPHEDWLLANWMTNQHTKGTTTLSAMVLRIYSELQGLPYQGRMG
jgi:hypothetical protein